MVTKQRLTTYALGALLLAGCLLALVFPAPASAIPLEQTVAPEATATAGPYVNPFFTPAPTTCPASANFGAGDTVVLVGGVVIRYGPNPSSPFLVTFQENRLFTVLEGGPLCVEGYNWYPITGHGITGWVSEGTRDGLRYWLTLQRRATDPAIACLEPLNLVEGNRFNINVNVRLRAMPSTSALTITVVPYTATVTVLDGPVCNEGYNWWWVRTTVVDFVYEGWLAESARAAGSEPYVVVPRQPDCHAPLRMDIGEQARVIYNDENPKRLRSAPTVNSGIIAELIENVPILIIGGPVCADSYNWWNVRVLSSTPFEGWLAEGGPANWWIAPISEFRR
jgi:hypothetical protein